MYKKVLGLICAGILFTGCNEYKESMKILPNEIAQADECKNINKEFELDCYELIAYKNTIALIRLGIIDESKKNYTEALRKYTIANKQKNFYSNALMAGLYSKGQGIKQDTKKAVELLENTSEIDPIAAYKLAIYKNSLKDKDEDDIIELLVFAGKNSIIKAQDELIKIYTAKKDNKNLKLWKKKKTSTKKDFVKKIYGF